MFSLNKGTNIIPNFDYMAKAVKKKAPTNRAEQYEPKVKFEGSFEDMIAISLTGAGAKKKKVEPKK